MSIGNFFIALFDAILCSENNLHDVDSLIREMWRVVKTDGHYIVISHGPPERRLPHFNRILPGVPVEVIRISKFLVLLFTLFSPFISESSTYMNSNL